MRWVCFGDLGPARHQNALEVCLQGLQPRKGLVVLTGALVYVHFLLLDKKRRGKLGMGLLHYLIALGFDVGNGPTPLSCTTQNDRWRHAFDSLKTNRTQS